MLKNLFFSFLFLTGFTCFAQDEINSFDSEGKRHGKWQKTFEGTDQLRYEGTFNHGKETGLFKFYKEDSVDQPAATKLFSDTTDLVVVKFYTKKGNLVSEGQMKDGKRTGKWTYYHDGKDGIMMTENYVNDSLEGIKTTFFENGKIAEEALYKNGKLNGLTKIYADNGNLIKEFTYVNGELHGPVKYYSPAGVLEIEGTYKNNLRDGIWKYYRNGKVHETKKFPEAFHSKIP